MKMGLVLLAVGGAFCVGRQRGIGEAEELREINSTNAQLFYYWVGDARQSHTRADVARSSLRDCEDALGMFSRVLDNRKPGDTLPGLRYINPEGEIITYHLPPPREKTGPGIGAMDHVRREAGSASVAIGR